MAKAALEASIATLETWIQLFAVLVAIGIVGEVGVGVRLWILHKRLQVIQHAEDLSQGESIARLNKEAGDARKDAGDALERAATSELRTAELNKAVMPRTFDREKLAAKLKLFPDTHFDTVSLSEFEPSLTTKLLVLALTDAKWIRGQSTAFSGEPPMSLATPGIWIEVAPPYEPEERRVQEPKLKRAADALISALRSQGIEANERQLYPGLAGGGSGWNNALHIYVSLKPFPGLPADLRIAKN